MVAEVEQKKETLPGAAEMFNVFGGDILEIWKSEIFFIYKIVIQIIRIFFYDNYNDFIVI